ncbi:MAG: 1-acyl-sn-glycerol-3-phosphate acyltransferase [Flavobacteriales bacterium]|nr:1-acyl-sn-glycerol-3-phosphate acyltransferase [Flavobacteriales bacterium]
MAHRSFDFLTELPTPTADGSQLLKFCRAFYRFLFFIGLSLAGVLSAIFRKIGGAGHAELYKPYTWYCRNIHRFTGIRVYVEGELPTHASVIVSNHRSYIDAVMVPSPHPLVFVAKAEVKHWPIIGWGGSAMRTIWVKRESAESRKQTRREVLRRIQDELSVIIFPEGTTHDGPDILDYKMGMFKMCADGGFPITPIAMEYRDKDVAWIGSSTFLDHAFRSFGHRNIDVAVRFGEVQYGDDPVELRQRIHEWTAQACLEMRAAFDAQPARP